MKNTLHYCWLLLILLCAGTARSQSSQLEPPAGAAVEPKEFRYSRRIPESDAGLAVLLLDAAVLAHSRSDLGDLRIANGDNRQIPYLLERLQDALQLNLSLQPEKTAAPESQSHYRLKLPFENLPAAKLVLTTTERTFQRNVSVEIERSQDAAETVASAIWRHNDPETPAPPLTLDLRASLGTASATVIVDEGDNHPLVLGAPQLELPLYRLRFFYPANAKLTLLYGHDTVSPPRYDLELLAPRLAGVSSRELALDDEGREATAPKNAIPARVFWSALIVAVLAISALLVRLLRSEKTAAQRD